MKINIITLEDMDFSALLNQLPRNKLSYEIISLNSPVHVLKIFLLLLAQYIKATLMHKNYSPYFLLQVV